MGFTYQSIEQLNTYLADKSYIEGYKPSAADLAVLCKIEKCPCCCKYPHAARWYHHITSFSEAQRAAWGGCCCKSSSIPPAPKAAAADDDDDVDLFAEDDGDDEAIKALQEKEKKEADKKKAEKKKNVDRSQIIFDVKGWDENTKFEELADKIRAKQIDGLVWGEGIKIVPLAFGVSKLQISCVIEDEKVATDDIQELIESFEDEVQSVDIFAFNKM